MCIRDSTHTVQTLEKLRFEVLENPAYSPNLSPSDYHLFGHLKGQYILQKPRSEGSGAYVACCVAKKLFSEGIRKLVQHWAKCIGKQGDYVEKS